MEPLELVNLHRLMEHTTGRAEISIGLIDGPVALNHPDLVEQKIRELPGKQSATCSRSGSVACKHGTFVAGILSAKRGSLAPAICPDCTLLVRPIFSDAASTNRDIPSAKPAELAAAIVETVDARARVINVSAALSQSSIDRERALQEALDHAARHNVILVVAAGNEGMVGSSALTRHPGVIPVVACDDQGRPIRESNLGSSIGRNGLTAPGKNIVSLGTNGEPQTSGGTSAAAPFVTGAIALLWSEFPAASAVQVKLALTPRCGLTQRSVTPPLLNAWAAYGAMKQQIGRQR